MTALWLRDRLAIYAMPAWLGNFWTRITVTHHYHLQPAPFVVYGMPLDTKYRWVATRIPVFRPDASEADELHVLVCHFEPQEARP